MAKPTYTLARFSLQALIPTGQLSSFLEKNNIKGVTGEGGSGLETHMSFEQYRKILGNRGESEKPKDTPIILDTKDIYVDGDPIITINPE